MIGRFIRGIATAMMASLVAACAGERPTDLGVWQGKLRDCPNSPNCVSSFAVDAHHRIEPFVFSGDADLAFARLRTVLEHRHDTVLIGQSPTYLRVELQTRLFVDDGEFLLDAPGQRIHVRSASRLGYSDLGKNRSRLESIRAAFQRSLAEAPTPTVTDAVLPAQ